MSATDERSDRLAIDDLRNAWVVLSADERVLGFGLLSSDQAEEFFLVLPATDAAELLGCFRPRPPALDAPARPG
jgi:hypothetical protein